MSEEILIKEFLAKHPKLAWNVISELKSNEILSLIRSLGIEEQKIVISMIGGRKATKVLEKMTQDESVQLLKHLSPISADMVFRAMPEGIRGDLLERLPEELIRMYKRSLSFTVGQIGAHLNSTVLALREDMLVQQALGSLKGEKDVEHKQFFVLNEAFQLIGFIEAGTLITSEPNKPIKSLIRQMPILITAEMSVKDVLDSWDDAFFELPVTNVKNEFLGIVTRQLLKAQYVHDNESGRSTMKAGSALAELYLIGLSSLLGNSGPHKN